MDEFGCDYACRTVGESITKYNIPDDWCVEFNAYDDFYSIICIHADQIRKAIMALKLRLVENEDDDTQDVWFSQRKRPSLSKSIT